MAENNDIQRFSSWRDVPEHLASKTTLRSRGLAPGPLRATVFQRSTTSNIELYSVQEATPRKAATEKQMAAIEKARAAQIANRTCKGCNTVMGRKQDLYEALCDYCRHEIFLDDAKIKAVQRMSHWLLQKDNYAILDVETNIFGDGSEIIQIAVTDLDENILFESFVKPLEAVSDEAYAVHYISNEMLVGAPAWTDVWPAVQRHIEAKTLLIYNEAFDRDRIYASCSLHGIKVQRLQSECVMETFARIMRNYNHYHRDFTWISLRDALYAYEVIGAGAHRAAEDCINVARLIRRVVSQENQDRK